MRASNGDAAHAAGGRDGTAVSSVLDVRPAERSVGVVAQRRSIVCGVKCWKYVAVITGAIAAPSLLDGFGRAELG
jgi:hypothetical protein